MIACPTHPAPTFGCDFCIQAERVATVTEAARTAPIPQCPECGLTMFAYDHNAQTMTIEYVCTAGFTQDGDALCDGETEVKVR